MLGKKLLQLSSTVTNSLYVIRTDVEDLKLHQGDMELPRADNSALESTSTKTIRSNKFSQCRYSDCITPKVSLLSTNFSQALSAHI